MITRGEYMDSDYNRFDSFHETMNHPLMKPGEWQETYRSAWRSFYSLESMKQILLRTPPDRYWDVFKNCIWYKSASHIEDNHPMITGFFRLKDRLSRRPGYAIDPWFVHVRKRSKELKHYLVAWVKLFLEMEELWLQTRRRGEKEQWVIDELQKIRSDVKEWRKLRVQDLHEAYSRAAATVKRIHGPHIKITIPSKATLYFRKINILSDKITYSREHLNEFWYRTLQHIRSGQLYRINPLKFAVNFVRDVKLTTQFTVAMFGGGIR
jgi:hypothetical protein